VPAEGRRTVEVALPAREPDVRAERSNAAVRSADGWWPRPA
jgi:hypothetical protein